MALNKTTPLSFLSLRFGVAFLAIYLVLLFLGKKTNIRKESIIPLAAMGFFEPILYFICEKYVIMYTTAVFSSVIIATIPIGTMFFQ